MKGNGQVSPLVAGIVIVVVFALVGFFLWRNTGPRKYSPGEYSKMMGQFKGQGMGEPGNRMGEPKTDAKPGAKPGGAKEKPAPGKSG